MPSKQNVNQFSLKALLWVITFFSALFTVLTVDDPFVVTIAGAVIAANILGALAALLVTHGLDFPRDGSYRYENRSTFRNTDDANIADQLNLVNDSEKDIAYIEE